MNGVDCLLLTGATGSFGRAYVAAALAGDWHGRIIAFSDTESNQSAMKEQFPPSDRLEYFIGNVRDYSRVLEAMHAGVDCVIHAAAMKEVPTCEYDWPEAVATNVEGSRNVALAAIAAGVSKALLISTDKAVDAVTEYGKTKAMAESWFVRSNRGYHHPSDDMGWRGIRPPSKGHRTALAVVRYGNVLASRGSIVPAVRAKLVAGDHVPLTDLAMTRFWWTLDAAVQFVHRTMPRFGPGEIWVPKLVAAPVISLLQAISGGETQVKVVGIRGKEKLHERLLAADEVRYTVDVGDAYIVVPVGATWPIHFSAAHHIPVVKSSLDYCSGNTDLWVDVAHLRTLLEGAS